MKKRKKGSKGFYSGTTLASAEGTVKEGSQKLGRLTDLLRPACWT